jgi:hypothetical protein
VDFVTNLESRLHHLDKQARASKTIALRRDRSWSSYAHIEVSKLPKDVDDLVALAWGESVIKCPSPLNVLKDTYDHSCY